MKHLFQVLTFGSYLICLVSGKANITAGLSFDCASNGSMLIFGAEAASYGYIYATGVNNTKHDTKCSCFRHVYGLNVTHEIRNCDIDYPVNVILTHEDNNFTDDAEVVGGMNVSFYQLRCNKIPIGGLSVTKKYNLTDGEKITYKPINETTLNLVMEVFDGGGSITKKEILIGTALHLVISGEAGFDFYLETCLAADGNHKHNKTLVKNGSSLDKNIITDFEDSNTKSASNKNTTTPPNMHSLDATLYAFHFVGSHVVEILCNITVCQSDDTSCSRSSTTGPTPSRAATGRRKRHVAPAVPRTQTLRTDFTVVDKFMDNVNDVKTSGASKGPAVCLSLVLCLIGLVRS